MLRRQPGGVRERPNRHDWKSCDLQGSMGSNPISSAKKVHVKFWISVDDSRRFVFAKASIRERCYHPPCWSL